MTELPSDNAIDTPTDGAEGAGGAPERSRHFIEQLIDEHIAQGRWGTAGDPTVVKTRFPPEPNGFLHVGHAKSIWLNFSLAEQYGGSCNLRFDDTNPLKEDDLFVRSIVNDVRWLGFRWDGCDETGADPLAGVKFASDYFRRMHDWAIELIEKGLAYVDEQSSEDVRKQRGTLTEPGQASPFRDRKPEESRERFEAMVRGDVPDGGAVLRAKIDMASPNMNLRDPVMYRVLNAPHHRTGSDWHVYPMYDWAHGLEDSIEGVTNSICTLEFEAHRPLYDWFIDAINRGRSDPEKIHHPQQTEFARLSLSYTHMSKRYMRQLVEEGRVSGWDDPRMVTVAGMRRRGVTPEALRAMCAEGGATKFNALVDFGRLENAVRDDLNKRAPRRMCVIRPLKVTITNWGEYGDAGRVEMMTAVNNPEDEGAGTREVPFGGTLYIERDDFMEDAPKKFFRLKPGGEVRLRYGYWITCHEVVKDGAGEVVELKCTYDPQTKGGDAPPADAEGNVRKVKGTLHWVEASTAAPVEVRLFDRLYTAERPGKATGDHLDDLNPDSLEIVEGALLEPNWRTTEVERSSGTGAFADGIERFQFERQGYFCVDPDSKDGLLVFNRTVTLKDSWAKAAKGEGGR
ncbi:MAG: glutamine--tRNA ligase [Phycisphaerae bacterium]|nr:glutamine--tRNA ligase [Phycisphaerae bacterium]